MYSSAPRWNLTGTNANETRQAPTVAFRPLVLNVSQGYYVDPYGDALGYEDVFTKLEYATRH
jgi:hypothetical protein